ncbi:NADH-quinone oxidoreductase subunit J family protein [Planctomicrobium sp. SH664]|uniref:NADH-quinone oxidoreductase subunit J family protein n=1 Tax=Planctomicrobium sp. SH664 TaxID=3448125 RepID=UPI003F5B535B
MEQAMFILYAALACGGALAVVLSQNVVRMAFYLVISLGSVAALFFLLNADFVGATQVLIYIGGTVVLLIFGVMLTSSAPFQSIKTTPGELLQGGAVGLAFLFVVMASVLSVNWQEINTRLVAAGSQLPAETGYNPEGEGNTTRPIGTALLGLRFDRDLHHAAAHGQSRNPDAGSTGYLLPFEIVSVHLLVVLVGAAYLARAKRRPAASGDSIT